MALPNQMVDFQDLQDLIDNEGFVLNNPFTPSNKLADKLEVIDALVVDTSFLGSLTDNQLVERQLIQKLGVVLAISQSWISYVDNYVSISNLQVGEVLDYKVTIITARTNLSPSRSFYTDNASTIDSPGNFIGQITVNATSITLIQHGYTTSNRFAEAEATFEITNSSINGANPVSPISINIEGVATNAVGVLSVVANTTSLNCSWTPPTMTDGTLDDYWLYLRVGNSTINNIVPGSASSFNITGLSSSTYYEVTLFGNLVSGANISRSNIVKISTL